MRSAIRFLNTSNSAVATLSFFFSDRLMRSLLPCLPLDCSQMRTGRTAARDPHPAGFVSARDTLGWISSVNCSVAVSTCPASDTAAELLLVTTQTRTSLHVVVVLTLVATIFTDTASIVDQADLLFVVILVRDSSSFSLLLLWPCKFKSSSPRPHREHSRLAASTAATLSRLYQPSGLRCTSRLSSALRSRLASAAFFSLSALRSFRDS